MGREKPTKSRCYASFPHPYVESLNAAIHHCSFPHHAGPKPVPSLCAGLSSDLCNPHCSHPRAQMKKITKKKLSQANHVFADRCASSGTRAIPAWSSFPCTQRELRPNPNAGAQCWPRAVTPTVLSSSLPALLALNSIFI